MGGRIDLAKYYNGAALLENMLILPFGGVVKRGGTQYIAEPKYHNKTARLVRFEYSTEQAYALEFGHQYIRFFKDQGQIVSGGSPYEIASPYEEADLEELYIEAQSADVLYITHDKYFPKKLMRLGHTDWRLENLYFSQMPTQEDYFKPSGTLTPGATFGSNIPFTASANVFVAGDVGRYLNYGVCRAKISVVNSGTSVQADILINFPDTAPIQQGSWSLSGMLNAPIVYDPNDGTNVWYAEGSTRQFSTQNSVAAFREADLGKYFRVLGGMVQIVQFLNAFSVNAKIVRELPQSNINQNLVVGNILLEIPAWYAENYPRSSAFFQNRLLMGGSPNAPQTVWGSKMGDFEDFIMGSAADAPFGFTISSGLANVIRWLAPLRDLFLGTQNAEWRLSGGGNGEAITPSNPPLVSQESCNGVAGLPPLIIGRTVIYADRFGSSLYQINYTLQNDTYNSDDLTLMAPDILKPGVKGLAFAAKPHHIIWGPRTDGVLCSLTIMREHEVIGWSRQITDGEVERVCTIPGVQETETWLLVKRIIGGQTKRYIELMKSWDYGADLKDAWFVDCGLQFVNSGAPVTELSNLEHLEGKPVVALVDGLEQAEKVVTEGKIPLDNACVFQAQVGLGYSAKLRTLNLNLPNLNQQGYTKRIHEVPVRLYRSVGGKAGPDADHLEAINPGQTGEFTGDKIVKYRAGWEKDCRVYLEHSGPTPFTVLAIMPRFEQGEK
jgi:hypothetical protein